MQEVVEGLCSFTARGACTDAERRAAVWLHDELRSRVHQAWVETRWVRPRAAAVLALGCLLAVVGSLLSTAVPVAGLVLAAIGAVSLAVEAGRLPRPDPRAVPAPRDPARAHRGARRRRGAGDHGPL